MDRDYIWEGEYGRRSHLIPVFQQLLREQDASSLQMLSLFVNNNPYNLEFFIAVSYDRPKEEHLDRMFRLLEDAGLRQRKDLTALNIMRAMADRRFNSASLLDEDSVPTIMEHLFFFPEIRVLEEKGYRMTPFGREQMVFLSHSSLDKPEIEEIIPLLNGMDLPSGSTNTALPLAIPSPTRSRRASSSPASCSSGSQSTFWIPAGVNLRCGPSSRS